MAQLGLDPRYCPSFTTDQEQTPYSLWPQVPSFVLWRPPLNDACTKHHLGTTLRQASCEVQGSSAGVVVEGMALLLCFSGALAFKKEAGLLSDPGDCTQVDKWDVEKEEGSGCQSKLGAPARLPEKVHQH